MKTLLSVLMVLFIAFLSGVYVQSLISKQEDRYNIRPYVEKAKAIKKEADARASFRGLISREQSSLLALLSSRNGGRVSDRDWLLLHRTYELFGSDAPVALAVSRSESGFKANAVGYNCMYWYGSDGCNSSNMSQAWSVDCGLFQLNFRGQVCPRESFDPVWNLEKAYEWKYLPDKKAGRSGFSAWVQYKRGVYLSYMNNQ